MISSTERSGRVEGVTILVDASVLFAYFVEGDVHHQKAQAVVNRILDGVYGQALLLDYVFDETVTVTLRKAGKKTAVRVGDFLIHSGFFLVPVSLEVFRTAWTRFTGENTFSFTDCTIIALAKIAGIQHIATFDKAFTLMEGITIVDK